MQFNRTPRGVIRSERHEDWPSENSRDVNTSSGLKSLVAWMENACFIHVHRE